uniref:Uncharacterized protein n=1 Tax=Panagrolaimus sp. JU765 TaxID=591449 RepID=A0AC34Q207_9BILA
MSEAEEGKVYVQARRSVDTYRYPFFLNEHDKYRTFCNRFHVVTVTKALWIYHLLLVVLITVSFFYQQLLYLWPLWVFVFMSGYTIFRQKHVWMWFFVIYVGLTFVMFILFGAYLFFFSIFIRRTQKTESIFDSTTISILIHLATLAFCLLHLWQFRVVNATRQYFKDKHEIADKIPFGYK